MKDLDTTAEALTTRKDVCEKCEKEKCSYACLTGIGGLENNHNNQFCHGNCHLLPEKKKMKKGPSCTVVHECQDYDYCPVIGDKKFKEYGFKVIPLEKEDKK